MNKKASNVNQPTESELNELLQTNHVTQQHKSVNREKAKKSKD